MYLQSGKLVLKMFTKIQEYIEDPQALVCVLIDEVESLTHARQSALAGTEPSDSIRVVNAVLTQIDQIRRLNYHSMHFYITITSLITCKCPINKNISNCRDVLFFKFIFEIRVCLKLLIFLFQISKCSNSDNFKYNSCN